jgi:hypothetical protein
MTFPAWTLRSLLFLTTVLSSAALGGWKWDGLL